LKWKGVDGSLNVIGIRPGEKLHEEMISDIEWMRTKDGGENYLITDEIITSESKSYNSLDSLMPDEEVYDFLKYSKVI
jgi:FlaA1/EpsC-like NDP-sugar epimerase